MTDDERADAPAVEDASQRGARVTQELVGAASRHGFRAMTEYPIPGGRIDVVWFWQSTIPGAEGDLPIVAFEVESSWRSRKHIKGDLVNLQDAAPLVGVIVLLGDGADVESTRRFASQLVDRPGCRIMVWSEEDVATLLSGESAEREDTLHGSSRPLADDRTTQAPTPAGALPPSMPAVQEHWGKYRPLWEWLRRQESKPVTLTFGDVEEILGFPLPASCRRHLPHWYGYANTAVGRAIRDAGWRARRVNLSQETVIFERELAVE